MPVLSCAYTPPPGFANGHLQTVFPALLRKDIAIKQRRVRILAADGNFLDLDVSLRVGAKWLADPYAGPHAGREIFAAHTPYGPAAIIVSHGLEGNAQRKYVKGMAKAFSEAGCDVIAWNQIGCGGAAVATPRVYHMGEIRDLNRVIAYALKVGYTRLGLVGFSMGGNQILRLAGEAGPDLNPAIKGLAVFSVPCDLPGSVLALNRRRNRLYMRYFMRTLHPKIKDLHRRFPEVPDIDGLDKIFTFQEFDDRFTAPLNGFASAADYYAQTSSLPLLEQLARPALLVNAADDPFLSPSCYPYGAAEKNPHLCLSVPKAGGHVGFVTFNARNRYWSEQAACDFLLPLL